VTAGSHIGQPSGAASGCAFADRCGHVQDRCHAEAPLLRAIAPGHRAACHHAERVLGDAVSSRAAPASGVGAEAHFTAAE